ncbi:MAG: metalloregulator ArsR/SmtB family transcription factor [Pseudomonadota bacterium]|uniref:ArsR/SmtB family transcription factor n=1 Tax=Roseixanthobacter finlandensis TaxID=3119922 RepID=UPI00372B52F8
MTDAFLSPAESELLAAQLRALAHPARLKVLETLARHQTCVCGEIVAGLPLAQSTVSQHIKVLAEAGLIRVTVDGPRSCYCIDHAALGALRGRLDGLFAALAPAGDAARTAALQD